MRVRSAVAVVVLTACTSSSSPDSLLPPKASVGGPSNDPLPGADPALPAADPHGGREAGSSSDASPDASGTAVDAGSPGGTDPYAAARKACVDAVNQYRAMNGLAALARYAAKESCADAQASADASHHVDHYAYFNGAPSCIEDNVLDRQNECPGWYQPPAKAATDCVGAMFAEGPGTGAAHGHYTTMMNASYTRLSCGFRVDPGSPPGADLWIVLNFY
jgi:hypothetical protein